MRLYYCKVKGFDVKVSQLEATEEGKDYVIQDVANHIHLRKSLRGVPLNKEGDMFHTNRFSLVIAHSEYMRKKAEALHKIELAEEASRKAKQASMAILTRNIAMVKSQSVAKMGGMPAPKRNTAKGSTVSLGLAPTDLEPKPKKKTATKTTKTKKVAVDTDFGDGFGGEMDEISAFDED